jgi:hypothetical protein
MKVINSKWLHEEGEHLKVIVDKLERTTSSGKQQP